MDEAAALPVGTSAGHPECLRNRVSAWVVDSKYPDIPYRSRSCTAITSVALAWYFMAVMVPYLRVPRNLPDFVLSVGELALQTISTHAFFFPVATYFGLVPEEGSVNYSHASLEYTYRPTLRL